MSERQPTNRSGEEMKVGDRFFETDPRTGETQGNPWTVTEVRPGAVGNVVGKQGGRFMVFPGRWCTPAS
jgi:hypothetical protein